MPCGGIYPLSFPMVSPCFVCGKEGSDHFIEEWDAFIHADCILPFLQTEEGQIVLKHRHEIHIVFPQKEGA
jgi:hypothetical protein